MSHRVHVGCGIVNPFKWLNWAGLIIGAAIADPILLVGHTFWGLLGWLAWGLCLIPTFWWEHVHSPAKMYRTWTP